jgi:endonuclease G
MFGYPLGTPPTNDLIIRDIYALSSNDTTKFADWVAYRLDRATVEGTGQTERGWKPDPWLAPNETLEPADYTGAHAALKVDRGHQAPLADFKGTTLWAETNYLSNITPQRSDLNQGPWVRLENAVRASVGENRSVWVLTGPLYEQQWVTLPGADEPHRIPSGYWKIIAQGTPPDPSSVRAVAFIFPQETPRQVDFTTFIVPIDEVEQRSGLDFFWELPDEVENALEAQPGMWPLPGPGVSHRVPSPEGVSSTGRLVAHRRR